MAAIEQFESRRLMSISLVNGIIQINGTSGADQIAVKYETGGVFPIMPAAAGMVSTTPIVAPAEYVVTVNKDSKTFAASSVKGVFITAGDGNDNISLNQSVFRPVPIGVMQPDYIIFGQTGINVPATVHGGGGNDTINGGNKADKLSGEAGDDVIVGWGGNDSIYGGSGNDTLGSYWHETGSDYLDGGTGNDNINGGPGNDTIHGGDGNDTVSGYTGDDSVSGGSGVDHFFLNLDPKGTQAKDFNPKEDINDGGSILPIPL